jgi:hypothetical protein
MDCSSFFIEILKLILSWQVLTFAAFLILRGRIFEFLNILIEKIPQAESLWAGSKFTDHGSIDLPTQSKADNGTKPD